MSELEKVVVELDHERTSPRAAANRDGFVHWQVNAAPAGRAEVTLTYTVKRHADVVGLDASSL